MLHYANLSLLLGPVVAEHVVKAVTITYETQSWCKSFLDNVLDVQRRRFGGDVDYEWNYSPDDEIYGMAFVISKNGLFLQHIDTWGQWQTWEVPSYEPVFKYVIEISPKVFHCYTINLFDIVSPNNLMTPMFGYEHQLQVNQFFEGNKYIGITGQHWLKRRSQHIKQAVNGSPLKFHSAIRDWYLNKEFDFKIFESKVWRHSLSKEAAMLWEEEKVPTANLQYTHILNMIPGGYEGYKLLCKLGYLSKEKLSNLRDIDTAKIQYVKDYHEKMMYTDEVYMKHFNSQPKWLKQDKIRLIKELSLLEYSLKEISEISVASLAQVKNLLANKTFSRIVN